MRARRGKKPKLHRGTLVKKEWAPIPSSPWMMCAELGMPAEKEFETSSNVIEDLVKWLMPFYGTEYMQTISRVRQKAFKS